MGTEGRRSSRGSGGRSGAPARPPASPWQAAPVALVRAFQDVVKGLPGTETRMMFGYPAAFANGHMFAGVFAYSLFVRLAERDRTELLRLAGAAPFEPMAGRVMKEYVVLPSSVADSAAELRTWVARALAYVGGLPPK